MLALLVLVTGAIGIAGAATGLWEGDGPQGLRLTVSVATIVIDSIIVLTYRRVRGPVGDLLSAAERVAAGDYGVDVGVRGPPEVRLLTMTFNGMATRLAANEAQRRRFLADVTHELRNPLAVLQSGIEAQMDGVHPRDDHHLASLLDETRRLGHLVDDLHTMALAETGRLVLQREAVVFGDLVQDVVARHEPQATQRNVTLRTKIAAGLPEPCVDPARIRQVLDNLLANAIRHSPSGSEVVVEVSSVEQLNPGAPVMVECCVADAGPGFREDQLDQVFERFKRAGDSRGSGLGLSIASDLVRAHGGTIGASNDPVTGGAAVTFTVPVGTARLSREHASEAGSNL